MTNSLYHRDYQEWKPVVITVESESITIQNVGGRSRSISAADIFCCDFFLLHVVIVIDVLGKYIKEPDMTECRSTSIQTIQNPNKAVKLEEYKNLIYNKFYPNHDEPKYRFSVCRKDIND